MSGGRLVVEKRGAVGWIVFDQPEKKNAISGAVWRGIPEAMAGFDADPEVRCVAFRGAGSEAFAAGADISEFEKVRANEAAVGEYDGLLDRVLHAIQGSPKPSLAMIHGFCLGGGLEVALACDLRYCGASAQFGIPAAKLGLAYNVEGHKRLFETVGHAWAREIMFLGRRYGAEEALAMGLVHRVLADAELEAYVSGVIETLAANAPLSIANSKTILEEYASRPARPTTRACKRRSSAARRARTTGRDGARSWKSASRGSRGNSDEDQGHPHARGRRADEAPARHQHRRDHRGAAAAHRLADRCRHRRPLVPFRPHAAEPEAPGCARRADGRDAEGRPGAALRHRGEAQKAPHAARCA
jgi:enoyl-CoA hydratase